MLSKNITIKYSLLDFINRDKKVANYFSKIDKIPFILAKNISFAIPALSRKLLIYGQGELTENVTDLWPESSEIEEKNKYLFSTKMAKLSYTSLAWDELEKIQSYIIAEYPSLMSYTMKLRPRFDSKDSISGFIFEGIYPGATSRFIKRNLKQNQAYLIDTGTPEIDEYQKAMLSGSPTTTDTLNPNAKIFDTYNKKYINNDNYLIRYKKLLDGEASSIYPKNFDGKNLKKYVLKPRKWKIERSKINETILDTKWLTENKLPPKVYLYIFGGQAVLNLKNKGEFIRTLKTLDKTLPKRIETYYFTEFIGGHKKLNCELFLAIDRNKSNGQ